MIKKCLVCQKEFYISPSRVNKRKMCSIKCKALSQEGKQAWNKGIKRWWKSRTEFKKGTVPWNKKGESVQKICLLCHKTFRLTASEIKDGRGKCCSRKCITQLRMQNSRSSKNKLDRGRFNQTIQRLVLQRDNYTCQICNKRGGILHVDHIQPFAEYLEGRFDIKNCRTLCVGCHYKVTWGKDMPEGSRWGQVFQKGGYYCV